MMGGDEVILLRFPHVVSSSSSTSEHLLLVSVVFPSLWSLMTPSMDCCCCIRVHWVRRGCWWWWSTDPFDDDQEDRAGWLWCWWCWVPWVRAPEVEVTGDMIPMEDEQDEEEPPPPPPPGLLFIPTPPPPALVLFMYFFWRALEFWNQTWVTLLDRPVRDAILSKSWPSGLESICEYFCGKDRQEM